MDHSEMWAYEEAYNNATGESATYRKGSSDYHSLKFVKWLVADIERIREEYTEVSVERSRIKAEVERLCDLLRRIYSIRGLWLPDDGCPEDEALALDTLHRDLFKLAIRYKWVGGPEVRREACWEEQTQ